MRDDDDEGMTPRNVRGGSGARQDESAYGGYGE